MPVSDVMDPEIAAQGFAAAGSDSRLRVLKTLVRAGEAGLTISDIQQRSGIAASTLAHHLRFLKSGGLITQHKQGRSVINRAAYDHIRALADFLTSECCADACATTVEPGLAVAIEETGDSV